MQKEKSEVLCDWCVDINGIEVKIENAVSGKHGYFCDECHCEMIAKKGYEKAHHFAHDATDVVHYGNCTQSNESYLHKVAKDVLQRIMQVKVPPLKKYPPVGIKGKPNLLRNAEIIKAHTVENEMSFYEDAAGKLCWGRKIVFESDTSKYFLFRPDVAFFDVDNKPILLIEIVVTHKITDDKLIKIKQLGINMIQVNIPRDEVVNLEKIFLSTSNTKWIYNHDRESAKYQPDTERTVGENDPLDEFETGLLKSGESFKCRSSQINNVVRAFNKYMEGNEYRERIRGIEAETAIVESNTIELKNRWEGLQKGHKEHLEFEFGAETQRIESLRKSVDERYEELRKRLQGMADNKTELEKRYRDKKSAIDDQERSYRAISQPEIDKIANVIDKSANSSETIGECLARITRIETDFSEKYLITTNRIKSDKDQENAKIESIESRRNSLRNSYESVEKSIRKEYIELGNIVRDRIQEQTEVAIQAIKNQDVRTTSTIATELQRFIDAGGFFDTYKIQNPIFKRMRTAKKQFESGTYKNWV